MTETRDKVAEARKCIEDIKAGAGGPNMGLVLRRAGELEDILAALQAPAVDDLRKAYLLGFKASAEGYNAEYPFEGEDIDTDTRWLERRDETLAEQFLPRQWLGLTGEDWRPIETAPKDGTRILVWCVHRNAEFTDDPIAEGWAGEVIAHWIDHNGGGWTWYGLCGKFTHWMPLPAAPTPVPEKGAENAL